MTQTPGWWITDNMRPEQPLESSEEESGADVQREIRRAIAKIRVAHEILVGLDLSSVDSIVDLLKSRAEALGNRLTDSELEVMAGFISGRSPESLAEERGLSERTISNQLRTGCHKLGFRDRRELKGWGTAIRGLNIEQ